MTKKMDFLLSNDHNFPVVYSLQSQKAISYLIVCKSHYILSLVFSYSRTPLYKSLITWGTLLPQTLREVSSNITLRDLTRNLRPAFLHHWSTSCCKHHIAIVQNTLWENAEGLGHRVSWRRYHCYFLKLQRRLGHCYFPELQAPGYQGGRRYKEVQEGREVSSLVPLPQTGSAATHTFPQRHLPNLTLAASHDEDYTTSKDKSFQYLIHLTINGKALTYLKPFVFTQDSFACPPPPSNFFQKDSHSPKDSCHT